MGTRSTTLFVEKDKDSSGKITLKKVCKFYRQMDGYPNGHGLNVAEFLSKGVLVNGIGCGENDKNQFNGIGCLAAQVIAELKKGPGSIYMIPITEGGQEYDYTVTVLSPWYSKDGTSDIEITVKQGRKVLFTGTPDQYIEKFG